MYPTGHPLRSRSRRNELGICTIARPSTPAATPLPARLDQLLQTFSRAHPGFPGVALAVRTPTLSRQGAAGVADRATRKPLTARAGFRIASVTKTFVATAILRLAEDGKLALGDPIARHLTR